MMDSVKKQWSLINCRDRTIRFLNQERVREEVQGIKRPLKLITIIATQLEKYLRKGCQIYVVQGGNTNNK